MPGTTQHAAGFFTRPGDDQKRCFGDEGNEASGDVVLRTTYISDDLLDFRFGYGDKNLTLRETSAGSTPGKVKLLSIELGSTSWGEKLQTIRR
jgi:hypothetical protein